MMEGYATQRSADRLQTDVVDTTMTFDVLTNDTLIHIGAWLATSFSLLLEATISH